MANPVATIIHRIKPPWLQNEGWATGNIGDTSVENLLILWVITVVWNVASIIGVIPFVKAAIHQHQAMPLLALAFPVAGLGFLAWALRRTTRIVKFGDSIFHPLNLPAVPGGNLAGTIHVARAVRCTGKMELRLVCVEVVQNGKNRSEHILWQQPQTLDDLPACGDGTDIPVLLHVPADARPSSAFNKLDEGIHWRLEARCKTAGVSYFCRFEVPVFIATPAEIAAAASAAQPVAIHRPVGASDLRRKLSEHGIICQPLAGQGLRIHFAAARSKSGAFIATIIGLAFTCIAVGIAFSSSDPLFRILTWSFAAIPLLMGLVFDFAAIYCWLATSQITARHGWLTVENRLLFFHWQKSFTAQGISDITGAEAGTWTVTSNSGQTTTHATYGISLKTRDGKSIMLAGDIVHQDYAAWLADEINAALGMA